VCEDGEEDCRRAESAGASALMLLRTLLRVRPGLVQSSVMHCRQQKAQQRVIP